MPNKTVVIPLIKSTSFDDLSGRGHMNTNTFFWFLVFRWLLLLFLFSVATISSSTSEKFIAYSAAWKFIKNINIYECINNELEWFGGYTHTVWEFERLVHRLIHPVHFIMVVVVTGPCSPIWKNAIWWIWRCARCDNGHIAPTAMKFICDNSHI